MHAQMADEAVQIGTGPEASNSYLQMDEIVDVALRTNSDAVHPGYGFLSENAVFAKKLQGAGVTFVGPPSSAIEAMGSKAKARELMIEAGVSVVPGFSSDDNESQDPIALMEQVCGKNLFPCLLKPVMGGGGKGMKVVLHENDFLEALESCKRESLSSFGDDRVIIERYLTAPRHVEFQIFADMYGNTVHLHERDCSIQRRHQKVLEEAPAPGLGEELRRRMGEVAVQAAKAVNYVGAGTVEFLLEDGTDDFFFCEMNTRLQVEHPVTEMVTGVDLVEWQLRIASGESLPVKDQASITTNGHAIEARIYAENPSRNFLPATGTLKHLQPPSGDGIRVDSGVKQGDTVKVFYDPMISKLIAYGKDREDAIERLLAALRNYQVIGTPTNIPFVEKCADHQAFREGGVTTKFLESYEQDVLVFDKSEKRPSSIGQTLCILSLLLEQENRKGITDFNHARRSMNPWSNLSGSWRVHGSVQKNVAYQASTSQLHTIPVISKRDGSFIIDIDGESFAVNGTLDHDGRLNAVVNEKRFSVTSIVSKGDGSELNSWQVNMWASENSFIGSETEFYCEMTFPDRESEIAGSHTGGSEVKAPMPGKVIKVTPKQVGEYVESGELLMVLEAMKMEHAIFAPRGGVIDVIGCDVGDVVNDGAVMIMLADADESNNQKVVNNVV
eukprot:CAMPEP_0196821590 /NCGR_PEP_ID=MMETSP1362-20130617/79967_1 /TAXON_ID=163516 /ORGANISM="Leptocylindrus danicus, Strain CCMP1856" /LENGTH=670 /DNA_ID=CAMNT_0042200831 /DNA_START=492 /DNA_END=2504 /DNA_ORIENTATION=-